jgi:hypothetical protein
MAGSIETITEQSRFDAIFRDSIARSDVFLKTSNGNLKIRFMGYTEGQVAFRIPYIKTMPERALVFARTGEATNYIELKSIDKQENEIFTFSPVKIQVIHDARGEDRAKTADGQKNLVFITNLTSDFLLYDCIKRDKKKIEFLRDRILSDLKKVFSDVKVFFCPEESGDQRMRFFNETINQPIHITDISKPSEKGKESQFAFYRENIYLKEQFNMKRKGLISEICVPVLFKKLIPIGYIQVNNTIPFSDPYISVLRRAADLAAQMVMKASIFTEICTEKLLVADISRSGIGFVFRDRKFMKFFKEKNLSCFDLILGGGQTIRMSATVKNLVLMENKIIKVGCSTREIDSECQKPFEEYLAAHIPPEPAKSEPSKKEEPAATSAPEQKKKTSQPKEKRGDEMVG